MIKIKYKIKENIKDSGDTSYYTPMHLSGELEGTGVHQMNTMEESECGSEYGESQNANPDENMDGVYDRDELYYHFDLDGDDIVTPEEYAGHVNWHAEHPEILAKYSLTEKKDRCYHLAKQKYDVFPSAYASGFIVRCRKGKVAKKKNEDVELEEEWSDKYKRSIDCNNPKGFSQRAHCQGRKKNEEIELDEGTFDKEKSSGLHGWFQRRGGKGKSKGWVDCNTCRTDKKTGRKTCKTCGRQDGESRSKYPACRPTPSACTKKGTSSKKSSQRVSWKSKKD